MTKILFICHGNICRSAAAEAVLKQMVRERGGTRFAIASAATSREEIGNDIYPPMARTLEKAGYAHAPHAARQTVRADYGAWDYIICMDQENLYNLHRIYGGDPEGRISLLEDWAGRPGREVEDPWYTRNFSGVLRQIEEGCRGILDRLETTSGTGRKDGPPQTTSRAGR